MKRQTTRAPSRCCFVSLIESLTCPPPFVFAPVRHHGSLAVQGPAGHPPRAARAPPQRHRYLLDCHLILCRLGVSILPDGVHWEFLRLYLQRHADHGPLGDTYRLANLHVKVHPILQQRHNSIRLRSRGCSRQSRHPHNANARHSRLIQHRVCHPGRIHRPCVVQVAVHPVNIHKGANPGCGNGAVIANGDGYVNKYVRQQEHVLHAAGRPDQGACDERSNG